MDSIFLRYYTTTMIQEITTHSKEETIDAGRQLASQIAPGSVIVLSGDLGAGKTTFTQGVLAGLGALGPYTSPTFVIMKQYDIQNKVAPATVSTSTNAQMNEPVHSAIHTASFLEYQSLKRVYHVDAYRIDTERMLAIGWEEWLEDSQGVVLLEWPERVADIVPETAIGISIEWVDEYTRLITIRHQE